MRVPAGEGMTGRWLVGADLLSPFRPGSGGPMRFLAIALAMPTHGAACLTTDGDGDMAGYKGILFDMDGVLVDSEPLFHKAVNVMVARCGAAPITEEENNRYLLGTTVEETWVRVKELRGIPQTPAELLAGYNEVVREVLRSDLTARPGVRALIAEAQRRGLPIAVASSSLREWVRLKLEVIGLADAFPVALGGDDVEQGKPAPDIYIKAAGLLGLAAAECVAIEDSPIGLAAAAASGAYTVCTLTDSTRHLDLSAADVIIESLEDFDYGLLAGEGMASTPAS